MQALQGLRVLDLTVFVQGALGSAMLADLGAEVIKVDPPGGDPVLGTVASFGAPQIVDGLDGRTYNVQYETANRGKLSLCLDLKSGAGREIIERLFTICDVVVTNLKESTLRKLGIDYEHACSLKPDVVYVTTSIFGPDGPDSDVAGFDISGVSRGGLMYAASRTGEPVYPVGAIGDVMGATLTGFAALTGIIARERNGLGQKIDTSQLGAVTWLQFLALSTVLLTGKEFQATGDPLENNPLFSLYECHDHRWLALAIYQGDRYWGALCDALGRPDLLDDPRFRDHESRIANLRDLREILVTIFAATDFAQLIEALRAHGVPFSPVNRVSDMVSDSQILANEYVRELDHPGLGRVSMPSLPLRMSATPLAPLRPASYPGSDAEHVLSDLCGFGAEEIGSLAIRGAFG